MIERVIFDWNGTLIADTSAIVKAGNKAIVDCGGKALARKEYIKKFHFPVSDFMVEQGADREKLKDPKAAEDFYKNYEQKAAKCRTRRGVRTLVDWLRKQSIDSVILSNHIQDSIMTQLQRLELTPSFKEVIGNHNYSATYIGNNKLERTRNYFEQNSYNPTNAIAVGDSPEDISIGKELGMYTVAITDRNFDTSRLRAAKPDEVITNLYSLVGIIQKYNL